MAYSISSSVKSIKSLSTSSSSRNHVNGRNNNGNGRRRSMIRNKKSTSSLCPKLFTEQEQKQCNGSIVEQYKKWCKTLKIELKEKSKVNVDVRMEKIEKIVNNIIDSQLQDDAHCNFIISDDDKKEMMRQIEDKIDSWRGVEIEVCKNKEKKNFEAYQATARNWFNRNKAKIYGNHLFYEMIYNHILKFCAAIDNISDEKRMILFIDIFERILNEPVQFPRTKLQPLLPHQALMQPNRFKKASEQFTLIYNIRWMLANNSANNSKRDRDRAKKIHSSFTNCLAQIKQQLETSSQNPPMPYPFDSIMNETGSTSSKSITSSTTKSISIDYEINDVAANHSSPIKQRIKYRQQHQHQHQRKKHKPEVQECANIKKLKMVDHLSGSTESTKDNNSNDSYSNNDSNDFYMNNGCLGDEYMKELPPTIEMSGCNEGPSKYNVQPSIINGGIINGNIINNGDIIGNNPINDMIDGYEVVYDDNFKIEQHVNDQNYNYYDPAYPMITGNEYDQTDNNIFNINTNYSQNYQQIMNGNNNNNCNINVNNNNNNNNNTNNNNHSSIDDQMIQNLPSIRARNRNFARVDIQPPYTPPYPNHANLVSLPGLNTHQEQYNSNNNDNAHNQRLQYQQQQINLTPETTLTGQVSSSSSGSSSSSDGNSLSSSYAPSRGTNSSYNVSRNRYSPLSAPNTPNTPIITRNNNINNNNSNNSNNNNNYNHRMIDQYQMGPFSPCYDNRNDNNNQFGYNQGPIQQIGFNEMDVNNINMVNIDNNINNINNNNMIENGAFMMNMNNNNNNHNNYGNNINDNFVFTNLSNISSPTPLLGGFL